MLIDINDIEIGCRVFLQQHYGAQTKLNKTHEAICSCKYAFAQMYRVMLFPHSQQSLDHTGCSRHTLDSVLGWITHL